MVYDTILLRYGEIFLKGRNKGLFERKLVENIDKTALKTGISKPKVIKSQGRLLMDYFIGHPALRRVFGLISYSPAVRVEKNTEEIQKKAAELLAGKEGTFRIATKRSDKSFPTTSPEFNRVIGEYVEQKTTLRFSSVSPELVLEIEINQEGAYLFFETIACGGGLPTGVEGRALLLIENEASLLAGLLFMKRGCSIIPVAFVEKDISLLQEFSPTKIKLGTVKNFQEVEQLAAAQDVLILVTGQVLAGDARHETNLIIMKPLIAYSKKQIGEQLKWFRSLVAH